MTRAESRFLYESNAIEGEYGVQAFKDASEAWEFTKGLSKISYGDILMIHKLLMQNLNPRIAGSLRGCDVTVGGNTCPSFWKVPALLQAWVEKYSDVKTHHDVKSAHIEFERIHPFEDGNGRTGRILMNKQFEWIGQKTVFFLEWEKDQYYQWFHEDEPDYKRWSIQPAKSYEICKKHDCFKMDCSSECL